MDEFALNFKTSLFVSCVVIPAAFIPHVIALLNLEKFAFYQRFYCLCLSTNAVIHHKSHRQLHYSLLIAGLEQGQIHDKKHHQNLLGVAAPHYLLDVYGLRKIHTLITAFFYIAWVNVL